MRTKHTNPDGSIVEILIGEGASIGEWASIGEGASIGEWASITDQYSYFVINDTGSRRTPCVVHVHKTLGVVVSTGCQKNILPKDFYKKVIAFHKETEHGKRYLSRVKFAVKEVSEWLKENPQGKSK